MLRRNGPRSSPANMLRTVLTPIAYDLGLDYDIATLSRPVTDAAVTLEAFRCAAHMLMASTYVDGWPEEYKKEARKGARIVESRMMSEQAEEAVSRLASGFGHAMAEIWRHAATQDEYADAADSLCESAARSDDLADRVTETIPVTDEWGVLPQIQGALRHRFVRPDQEGPDIWRLNATVNAEGQALALGPHFDEVGVAVISPIMGLHLRLNAAGLADWGFIGDHWRNAISDEPVAYGEVTHESESEPAIADDG